MVLQSEFLRTVRDYCERYGVRRRDRLRIVAHYPLFKLLWYSLHGSPRQQGVAQPLSGVFQAYGLRHRVVVNGRSSTLRVPFGAADIASFQEVFFGEAYRSPFDLAGIRSFVDLGANTGLASVYFLLHCPRVERALLVEANPALQRVIRANLRGVSSSAEIELEQVCVGDGESEWIEFVSSSDHRMSGASQNRLEQAPAGTLLRVRNLLLSTLLDRHGFESADLLKIDIEGAEYAVAEVEAEVFRRFRYLFAEVHGEPGRRAEFVSRIEGIGFRIAHTEAGGPLCDTLFAERAA